MGERNLLVLFNKIAISNNKFQMASGQGSQWLIESPTIFSSMCSPPLSDSLHLCCLYFKNLLYLVLGVHLEYRWVANNIRSDRRLLLHIFKLSLLHISTTTVGLLWRQSMCFAGEKCSDTIKNLIRIILT